MSLVKVFTVAVIALNISACALLGGEPQPNVAPKVSYVQLDLRDPVDPFYRDGLADIVAQQCYGAERDTGGEQGFAFGGSGVFEAWGGQLIVNGIKAVLKKRIEGYTLSAGNKESYFPFYEPAYWRAIDENNDGMADFSLGCFVVAQRSADSTSDTELPQFVVVGQYKRTAEYLQMRPVWAMITEMATEYKDGGRSAAVVNVVMNSVSFREDSGQKAVVFDAPLLKSKFEAADFGSVSVLDVELVVWDDVPFLPLPPISPGISQAGYVGPVATVTQASNPRRSLKWIKRFLDSQGDDVSKEVRDALDELL